MAGISTALVSTSGRLLLELDDGIIIDAGRVVGGQGPAGERGLEGPRGANGVDGQDGANGAMWHTGVGAPELSLGENGDLYMDVANSLLPIYQKVNGDWLLLCNLKVSPSGGGGGAGGAAGGGGSIIIYPKPDGGAPPSTDNDGKPIDKGDIWLDTNTGWLWVYDGSVWLPVGDRPPVIISPNPPLWNSSGDTNNRYPIVEGSLWFDSDQLALYVAAKDSGNNLVWVITTPADRSVLLNDIPVNPFVFPAPTPGTYANDGDTVYNTTTELWYIYNASKNQWIDLPPGNQELSLQAILLRGADNFPPTFEYEPADRVTYDTEALCYVNADDHPGFTRIVVPFVDTAGFDWTVLLRSIRKGDQLSLIQIDAADPLDPDDDFPFRSDYLTISDITENADSLNVDLEFQQENPDHLPLFGEPVAIRFKAIINVGDREIYYQEDAPDLINNPNLGEGNLWVDSDDNKMYVWNGSTWSEVTACTGVELGDYVKKVGGDSMEGPLVMQGPRKAGDDPTKPYLVSSIETLNVDNTQNSGLHLRHNGASKVYIGSTDVAFATDIKFNRAQPTIIKNNTQDIVSVGTNEIQYLGVSVEDNSIITKKYVDDIAIELEEEIDAIAPSVERGVWKMTLSGSTSSRGLLTMYDDTFGQGSPIGIFAQVKSVWFHEEDIAGTPHGFNDVDPGYLLELFVEGEPDYGLFEVVEVHDQTVGSPNPYYAIDVNFVRALSNTAKADPNDLVRMKTFQAPSGGTADGFVLKSGDVIEGELLWYGYKPAAGGNPAENAYHGIKIVSKESSTKYIFQASTGSSFENESVKTSLVPTGVDDITNKKYVDGLWDFSQYSELT